MTQPITITRNGPDPIHANPPALDITPADFQITRADGHYRLTAPPGWSAEPIDALRWRVTPHAIGPDRRHVFVLEVIGDRLARGTAAIPIRLDLRSSFDARSHALPLRNRAAELGEVNPMRRIFDRTYAPLPEPLRRLLFAGLYSDIVFLRSVAPRGGMCSGMARWALARGRGEEPAPASTAAALERIQLFHGRQMKDRALLSALPWLVRGSPRAAYRAVRRDLLRDGVTDRALDIAVPKLWRRDLFQAVVGEGHTVVPYRVRQDGPSLGAIEVYDPNHPDAIDSDTPRTIAFDLSRNRYSYGTLVDPGQSNVGMIAVRQRAYSGSGTAFIALLGSLVLHPKRGARALFGRAGR